VCGRNEHARERLRARAAAEPRLEVHGYRRDVHLWLAAADVVSGKAGGLSVSEALAVGRPLVLTRPIPGAEEGNMRVLAGEGAALCGRDDDEMAAAFARVFREPGLLERLSANARRLGRPDAARTVAAAAMGHDAAVLAA
jgi:processive 1,2-diacylglycerol beta-glucosyltransferase